MRNCTRWDFGGNRTSQNVYKKHWILFREIWQLDLVETWNFVSRFKDEGGRFGRFGETFLSFLPDPSSSALSPFPSRSTVSTSLPTICHLDMADSSTTAKSVLSPDFHYHVVNLNKLSVPWSSLHCGFHRLACLSAPGKSLASVLTSGP